MDNLLGIHPSDVLVHGPSKLLVDKYHWHDPEVAIVGSYTPQAKDVVDHFGVFRGVDQIEAFGQATIGSCVPFLEAKKQNCTLDDLKGRFIPTFIGLGQVHFQNPLVEGETFICVGHIKFHKFRQMVADGRVYKIPRGLDLDDYFKDFPLERLKTYNFGENFTLIAEINDITGRAIKVK